MSLLLLFFCLTVGLWKFVCVLLRRRRASLVQRLHPLRHSHTIYAHLAFVDFPFLVRSSLEFGLFRTYAIPSISHILSRAGHFAENASKRYDDTDILCKEMLLHHIDGARGSLALRRLNFIHSHYKISNADFLYVLSIFILLPMEWISVYGFRDLTEVEKQTIFILWHDIGTRMGVLNIPPSIEKMALYKESYESQYMVYNDTNKEIAELTMELLLSEVPVFIRPVARRIGYAFMDDRLRKAMGYPKQAAWLSSFAQCVLKLHGFVVRWMPPRSLDRSKMRIPSGCPASQGAFFDPDVNYILSLQRFKLHYYEDGYKIKELGAMKPGCLGEAFPGELLLPLSECSNLRWPFALVERSE